MLTDAPVRVMAHTALRSATHIPVENSAQESNDIRIFPATQATLADGLNVTTDIAPFQCFVKRRSFHRPHIMCESAWQLGLLSVKTPIVGAGQSGGHRHGSCVLLASYTQGHVATVLSSLDDLPDCNPSMLPSVSRSGPLLPGRHVQE